jgi:hypothetical protein
MKDIRVSVDLRCCNCSGEWTLHASLPVVFDSDMCPYCSVEDEDNLLIKSIRLKGKDGGEDG